ncbi:MAG: hypothetical protein MSIBF_03225 [Candidatus Altiarchaeales archaeon IMC4]|nr:MAG: hypothetical protein MSIBF_03225 [Candidatus Altiarchaeales archaeon IMC4]
MKKTEEKIRKELYALIKDGRNLVDSDEIWHIKIGAFADHYHTWYTRSLVVVRHILPDRVEEFERLYHIDNRKHIDISNCTIEDYLLARPIHRPHITAYADDEYSTKLTGLKFSNQVAILASAASRLDDILADIEGVLQADLFDSEIDAAKDLHKNGHLRAAGALAGVVLESHLAKVCQTHRVEINNKKPNISDFNGNLYRAKIYDNSKMQHILYLGTIRHKCVHKKEEEPTPEEVKDLIDGVVKVIKTIS